MVDFAAVVYANLLCYQRYHQRLTKVRLTLWTWCKVTPRTLLSRRCLRGVTAWRISILLLSLASIL